MRRDGLDIFFTAPPGEPQPDGSFAEGQTRVPGGAVWAALTGLTAPPMSDRPPRRGAPRPPAPGTDGGTDGRTGGGGRTLTHLELRAEVDRCFDVNEHQARMVIKDWLAAT